MRQWHSSTSWSARKTWVVISVPSMIILFIFICIGWYCTTHVMQLYLGIANKAFSFRIPINLPLLAPLDLFRSCSAPCSSWRLRMTEMSGLERNECLKCNLYLHVFHGLTLIMFFWGWESAWLPKHEPAAWRWVNWAGWTSEFRFRWSDFSTEKTPSSSMF